MKKLIIGGIIMYTSLLVVGYAQMVVPDSENYILNENDQQVLNTDYINDPLRGGAYNIIDASQSGGTGVIGGIVGVNDQISSHVVAQTQTINVIKSIINYALGMVALVALIYLIYHGFIILTAAGDDAQYKKGLKGIKFAAIAMVGIAGSRLIVSGIFWLIALVIGP